MLWQSILSSLVYGLAGFCAFVFLYNRVMIDWRDSVRKHVIILFILLVIIFGPMVFGWHTGLAIWSTIPLSFLGIVLLGEVQRNALRRRYQAPGPVATTHPRIALLGPVTTTELAVHRYALPAHPAIPRPLRIAHISDLHLNDILPEKYYLALIDELEAAQPDLIFITGDIIADVKFKPMIAHVLGQAKAPLGTYAILGNHDFWAGAKEIIREIEKTDVKLLHDNCIRLPLGGKGELLIGGCEEPWSKRHWTPPARQPDDLLLMLTHTPDNIYKLSKAGADAVFAGHFHAGQFRIPGIGSLVVPSKYGRRFDHGHFRIGKTDLFVTAGIGVSSTPAMRVYCTPDIFIVDFAEA